jgi:prepilin-type N-terminal cleavage/methylation domain-containing protein
MYMSRLFHGKAHKGFTLVELAVVIVIIGVLAAFGVPRFLKSVERSKASEAYAYLSAVRDAQERYIAREGVYATALTDLDINQSDPKYFDIGTMTTTVGGTGADDKAVANGGSTWTLTLSRKAGSSSYGTYSVIFTQDGYDSTSTIPADISPMGADSASSGSGS